MIRHWYLLLRHHPKSESSSENRKLILRMKTLVSPSYRLKTYLQSPVPLKKNLYLSLCDLHQMMTRCLILTGSSHRTK